MMNTSKTILRVQQLEARDVPASTFLGAADPYNVMVFGNLSSQYSDTQGAMAVGGNATLNGYSVGASLPSSSAGESLVVGGNLNFTNGQVANGSAEVGGTITTSSFGIPNGTVQSGQYLNFASAQTQLDGISSGMAAVSATGTVVNNWGSLTLTGTASGPNFFDLTAAQLSNCYGLTINVPQGSSVIINVSGQNVSMQYFGINLNGASSSNVVWNFSQATNLTISGIGIPGNVLAPYATVEFNNGQINGTLVAENFCGSGQFNWVAPTPAATCASISGSVYQTAACQTTTPDAGVTVTLAGTDNSGNSISQTTTTDTTGYYSFSDLSTGNYTLSIGASKGQKVTSTAGSSGGNASQQMISNIVIDSGTQAKGYQFTVSNR